MFKKRVNIYNILTIKFYYRETEIPSASQIDRLTPAPMFHTIHDGIQSYFHPHQQQYYQPGAQAQHFA